MNKDVIASIESAVPVPAHIAAIANACRYDLLHGPSWLRLPAGDIQQVNDDCLATYRADLEDEMQPGDTLEESRRRIARLYRRIAFRRIRRRVMRFFFHQRT